MIGDIIVGALLIISGFINVLAIGSFWITPSLRTTANRFVINLLLVNFISCLILSPFAFNVNANSPTSFIASPNNKINNDYYSANENASSVNDSNSYLAADVASSSSGGNSEEVLDNNGNKTIIILTTIVPAAVECSNKTLDECLNEAKQMPSASNIIETIENISLRKYQSWSLDLVVALSVLSVLLVILDTFIAVTDPLRYHARISDLKAWLLIAFCWILSISFGIASALRAATDDEKSILSEAGIVDDKVFNTMFLLTYFLLIIMMPFLLVILMYWRIYSEARESGQRMRQNGSSPLLQSALNLAATANAHQQQSTILTNPQCILLMSTSPHHHHQHHHNHHHHANKQQIIINKQDSTSANTNYFINNNLPNSNNNNNNNSIGVSDGLTMKIDKQQQHQHEDDMISNQTDYLNINGINNGAFNDNTKTFLLSSPPHECMPMLGTIDENSIASKSQQHQNILLTLTTVCEQTIKRNHSVKHLHLLTESDFNGSSRSGDAKIVDLRQVQSTPNLQNVSSSELMTGGQEQTLELPSIQASPKALRYMTSLRHRLSNASSLFKYREEGRAARISILVVIMFLITYLPYGILSLIHGQESIIKESNITLLSVIFVLLANLCSPIIFAYRNKRVRRGVRRLLGVDKKTNERLEKLNSLKRTCSTRIKNYRQNNLHKSLNLGIKGNGIKASNIRRTKSFQTCNYLTPSDAAKISLNNTSYSNNNSNNNCEKYYNNSNASSPIIYQKNILNGKEKKSILKIVADSSRKFRCQFTNCQNGINQDSTMPAEV